MFLRLVSGMMLTGASIALIISPIRNDLPYIELSNNFALKISRAVCCMLACICVLIIRSNLFMAIGSLHKISERERDLKTKVESR